MDPKLLQKEPTLEPKRFEHSFTMLPKWCPICCRIVHDRTSFAWVLCCVFVWVSPSSPFSVSLVIAAVSVVVVSLLKDILCFSTSFDSLIAVSFCLESVWKWIAFPAAWLRQVSKLTFCCCVSGFVFWRHFASMFVPKMPPQWSPKSITHEVWNTHSPAGVTAKVDGKQELGVTRRLQKNASGCRRASIFKRGSFPRSWPTHDKKHPSIIPKCTKWDRMLSKTDLKNTSTKIQQLC